MRITANRWMALIQNRNLLRRIRIILKNREIRRSSFFMMSIWTRSLRRLMMIWVSFTTKVILEKSIQGVLSIEIKRCKARWKKEFNLKIYFRTNTLGGLLKLTMSNNLSPFQKKSRCRIRITTFSSQWFNQWPCHHLTNKIIFSMAVLKSLGFLCF